MGDSVCGRVVERVCVGERVGVRESECEGERVWERECGRVCGTVRECVWESERECVGE